MIDILSCTRNWFVDGTFMIVKQPFTQLLNVIILNTISKRQDGSDLFRILHTKSFSKFTKASVYYVIAVC